MLSQAKLNQAWRLRPAEAFTSLYGQITMNRWEREGLVKTWIFSSVWWERYQFIIWHVTFRRMR